MKSNRKAPGVNHKLVKQVVAEVLRQKNEGPMYTYFVSDDMCVKIGKAQDYRTRHNHLQIGNPRELKLLTVVRTDVEEYLHGEFSHLRVRGEWFLLDRTLQEVIRLLKADREHEEILSATKVAACTAKFWGLDVTKPSE